MARIAGRNGRLYVGITSAGVPSPIAFISKYALTFTVDKFDVTAFGDTGKVYVAGFPDVQGTYTGWYDDASAQLYTAAVDGVARKVYLYTDSTNNTQYWYGTAIFDFNIDEDSAGAVAINGTFAAASAFTKIG